VTFAHWPSRASPHAICWIGRLAFASVRSLVPPDPPLGDTEIILRPSAERDVAAIRAVYSEPDIRQWMGWDGELPDEAEARANIERAASAWREGSWAVFRIADAVTDEVVGGVNLRFFDNEIAEVSYFLRASARGRGLATRAVRLVARWAFDQLGIQRIELRVHPQNMASRRVAERAGFSREGIERASRAWPDGTRFDSILFSLIPGDALE
jgi:RimJ/RimL family protein N-acetyltransferase